jgi:hypothetical protein
MVLGYDLKSDWQFHINFIRSLVLYSHSFFVSLKYIRHSKIVFRNRWNILQRTKHTDIHKFWHFEDSKGSTNTPLHNLPLATHRYFCSGVFLQHRSRDGCGSLRGKKGYARIYRARASLNRRRNSTRTTGKNCHFCAKLIYGTYVESGKHSLQILGI